jgi:uncharacterized protein (DUF58 family)
MARQRAAAEITASDIGAAWVDTAWLARLEQRVAGLAFTPYRPRASILAGRHGSRLRGRGLDFESLRGYLPGDDVHHIDWKASQRTGRPLVRVYTEERDRPALLVVDQRIDMFFGSRHAMKSVVAAELAALGAWMAFHAGDRVGAIVFNDTALRIVRPLRSRARVQEILGAVAALNRELSAGSPARPVPGQLDAALEAALRLSAHDHLVCVISDFAGAGERTQRLLRELAGHNDVVAALVFDPLFQTLPAHTGRMVVTEGDLQVELNFGSRTVREPIEAFFTGRLRDVGELLKHSGVPVMALATHEDTLEQLRRFLGRAGPHGPRAALAGGLR